MNPLLQSVYQNEYDIEVVRALSLLGGPSNQSRVSQDVDGMIEHAKAILTITNALRLTVGNNFALRTAVEKMREEAARTCAWSLKAADGTIVLIPKHRIPHYTESVLEHYEKMMSYLDWYVDLSGETT